MAVHGVGDVVAVALDRDAGGSRPRGTADGILGGLNLTFRTKNIEI